MDNKKNSELSLDELRHEETKVKKSFKAFYVIFGITIGVALYGTINKGMGSYTFFPLVVLGLYYSYSQRLKAIQKEINSRNPS